MSVLSSSEIRDVVADSVSIVATVFHAESSDMMFPHCIVTDFSDEFDVIVAEDS